MRIKPINKLSLVCPVFNENNLIELFLSEIQKVLEDSGTTYGFTYEIIVVDDGSTDDSLQILKKLCLRNKEIKVFSLSRNFGHQNAIFCGLQQCEGDAIIIMDSDFQDNPKDIKTLLLNYTQDVDVVYAIRSSRKESLVKKIFYFSFYRIINKVSTIKLPVDAGDFCIMDKRICDFIINSTEYHKYLRGLRAWAGFNQKGVPIERQHRHSGESKYSLIKLLILAFNGICSFSTIPLRIASVLGLFMIATSVLFILYILAAYAFFDSSPVGYSSTIIIILSLFGINLFLLGIIGEYIARIYEEIKKRPSYILKERINSSEAHG